jgi:hypothetical protein
LKNKGPNYIAQGLRVTHHASWVSHFLFANDCLVFLEAKDESALSIVSIVDDYNKGSGQLVNKNKLTSLALGRSME